MIGAPPNDSVPPDRIFAAAAMPRAVRYHFKRYNYLGADQLGEAARWTSDYTNGASTRPSEVFTRSLVARLVSGYQILPGVEALNGTIGSSNNGMAFADKPATEATSLAQRIRQTLIDMIRYTKLKPLAYSRLV